VDGSRVKFWKDRWADGNVLQELFPRLYSIYQCKDSAVGELADRGQIRSGECHSWNLGWRKERFQWEKLLEDLLLATISKVKWNMDGVDRLLWVGKDQYE